MGNTFNISEFVKISGCKIASIVYESEEKLPKYVGISNVTKVVSGEVQINFDYENAVNNRLEKQGGERTFNALSLPWGQWLYPNKVIEHKGEYYIRFYELKGAKMSVEYYVNGRPATDTEVATIKAYKDSKSTASARQSAEGLTENQVKPKNVKATNILFFKCGEFEYTAEKLAV